MPLFHLVRHHEYCVEAASEAEANALLVERETDAIANGFAVSETVSSRAVTDPGTVSDDLLDAVPYNGTDDTARTILNR